jgi:hypothetical protein
MEHVAFRFGSHLRTVCLATAGRPGARSNRRVSHTLPIIRAVLKLLLISVLFATFVLPAATASGKKPLPSLRAMLTSILLAELAYAFFLRFIYGHLV